MPYTLQLLAFLRLLSFMRIKDINSGHKPAECEFLLFSCYLQAPVMWLLTYPSALSLVPPATLASEDAKFIPASGLQNLHSASSAASVQTSPSQKGLDWLSNLRGPPST